MRKTLYFGYGSNLWKDQMKRRCPDSTFLGIGRLDDYEWIISERGYANVVPDVPQAAEINERRDSKNVVWGLVYALSASDEYSLDKSEGVPRMYQKQNIECHFWEDNEDTAEDRSQTKTLLVYVSKDYITKSKPKQEYIHRMNMGIMDALQAGVPKDYVKDVIRQYIPAKDESVEQADTKK